MDAYNFFKFFAFQMDPEKVHDKSLTFFHHFPRFARMIGTGESELDLSLSDGHMRWSFPVGLAAGFDKNAYGVDFLSQLGFGAVEVGTVTKLPQAGNPRPRITRHPSIESLQNSMGFPNLGEKVIAKRLQKKLPSQVVGVNIGKNKQTNDEKAFEDYAFLFKRFKKISNYIVINVSSPNTPGLRALQNRASLSTIFNALKDEREDSFCPLYLKLSPDLSLEEIKEICEVAKDYKLQGLIATNTTTDHPFGKGGLSGEYLKARARKVRSDILAILKETPEISLIAAGGINSFQDIYDFWKEGGRLVQIYTSFIYQGPKILIDIQKECESLMRLRGHQSLTQLVEEIRKDG